MPHHSDLHGIRMLGTALGVIPRAREIHQRFQARLFSALGYFYTTTHRKANGLILIADIAMESLHTDAQIFCQSTPLIPSESTRDLSPDQAVPTSFNNLHDFHLENCAHSGPISSGLAVFELTRDSDQPDEKASAGIDDWWQDGLPERCPCLDFIQSLDHPDNLTEISRGRTSHLSSDVSSRSSSVPIEALSFETDTATEGSHSGRLSRRISKSKRLPSDAIKVLRSWLYSHKDYPYPTSQEREDLERQTGLEKTQVLNWFTNARRRKMTGRTINHDFNTVDHTLLSPMERWHHSPSENEPAMTSDIKRAAENTPYIPSTNDAIQSNCYYETCSSHTSNSSRNFAAPSMGSYEHSHSSGSEFSYQPSRSPFERSPTPIPQMRPRRHRRRMKGSAKRPREGRAAEHRPYQCTFCSDSFRSKYDWQRHEKALHLSIDRWNCAPEGGITEINGVNSCVFCLAPDADMDHLETHNYVGCREKPSQYRSFSRKDHLVQHLRLTHDVPFHSSMNDWRDSITPLLSLCGFCDTQLFSWQERADHIAEHFKSNADMNQWQGFWGFEPHIETLVENAMPPYLLGQERRTMDPWKALDPGMIGNELPSLDHTAPNALDRYDFVRAKLTDYLRQQISVGNYPSDERIQDEARMIAYGDDDPWNQTYADDPAFINSIRKDLDLELGTSIVYEGEESDIPCPLSTLT